MPRSRRSRFTVHGTHRNNTNDKVVVLASDALVAEQTAIRHGWTVTNVTPGDYRKQARAEARRSEGGYVIDQDALRDACDLLGLRLPVSVRFNSRVGNTQGNYRFMADRRHNIMLKSYLTVAEASSCLWHELTHAMQAEQAGATVESVSNVIRSQARITYLNRPMEVEARAMSDLMSADHPLCKGV